MSKNHQHEETEGVYELNLTQWLQPNQTCLEGHVDDLMSRLTAIYSPRLKSARNITFIIHYLYKYYC